MARLPLADASRVHAETEAGARRVDVACDASLGERRVAALVRAVCGDSGPDTEGRSVPSVEIGVTVDLSTLVGLSDEPVLITLGSGPAEPATAAALRDLLAEVDQPVALRRLVTDPMTGALLDRGRTGYRVTMPFARSWSLAMGPADSPGACGERRPARSTMLDRGIAADRRIATTSDRSAFDTICSRRTRAGNSWPLARMGQSNGAVRMVASTSPTSSTTCLLAPICRRGRTGHRQIGSSRRRRAAAPTRHRSELQWWDVRSGFRTPELPDSTS
jgi:hypothetical protein